MSGARHLQCLNRCQYVGQNPGLIGYLSEKFRTFQKLQSPNQATSEGALRPNPEANGSNSITAITEELGGSEGVIATWVAVIEPPHNCNQEIMHVGLLLPAAACS